MTLLYAKPIDIPPIELVVSASRRRHDSLLYRF